MGNRARRAVRPTLEGVEARELPASTLAGGLGAAMVSTFLSGSSGVSARAVAADPSLIGRGTPSSHEAARQSFRAVFSGTHTAGPGRFSDQSQTFSFRGAGGSNFFLHGDLNMGVVVPTDPAAGLNGLAVLQDRNANGGGTLGLTLAADVATLDGRGRPTRMNWTVEPSVSSGTFALASGKGTADIRYGRGVATVVFQGQVYTTGLTNPLKNASLVESGQPVVPLHRARLI